MPGEPRGRGTRKLRGRQEGRVKQEQEPGRGRVDKRDRDKGRLKGTGGKGRQGQWTTGGGQVDYRDGEMRLWEGHQGKEENEAV